MRYWPLLAGYLLFASPVVMAAEGDTAAPTAETDGATSPSGGGTEATAPDGGGSGGSDPGCD